MRNIWLLGLLWSVSTFANSFPAQIEVSNLNAFVQECKSGLQISTLKKIVFEKHLAEVAPTGDGRGESKSAKGWSISALPGFSGLSYFMNVGEEEGSIVEMSGLPELLNAELGTAGAWTENDPLRDSTVTIGPRTRVFCSASSLSHPDRTNRLVRTIDRVYLTSGNGPTSLLVVRLRQRLENPNQFDLVNIWTVQDGSSRQILRGQARLL